MIRVIINLKIHKQFNLKIKLEELYETLYFFFVTCTVAF